MSNVVYKVNLIKSDPVNNNNKFWRGTLFSDNTVLCEWGRVGDTGQSKTFPGAGRSFLDKKVAEKKRAGRNGEIEYRELDLVEDTPNAQKKQTSVSSAVPTSLSIIAKKQIKHSDPEVAKLIDYLTKENIHQIASSSNNRITYNYDSNVFQTPLGIVSQKVVDEARDVLSEIANLVPQKNYGEQMMKLTRDFLMLIPQDTGRHRLELAEFWSDMTKVQAQNAMIDGLQASLVKISTGATKPIDKKDDVKEERVFDTSLDTISDKKTLEELFGYYYDTRHTMHSCYHFKPISAWKVDIASMRNAFENAGAKMKCIIRGFHGSGTANMLSLLKSGMLVKPPKNAAIAGALFGSGIYSAPIFREDKKLVRGSATKALGYSTGYWTRTSANRTFMFIVDMAMGKYYIPEARTYQSTRYPVSGYDSTWAYGEHSGVRNDEAIVYNANQVNIKYLLELKQ